MICDALPDKEGKGIKYYFDQSDKLESAAMLGISSALQHYGSSTAQQLFDKADNYVKKRGWKYVYPKDPDKKAKVDEFIESIRPRLYTNNPNKIIFKRTK